MKLSIYALAMALILCSCGQSTATLVSEAASRLGLASYNISACESLEDRTIEADLATAGTGSIWGTTYQVSQGRLTYQGETLTDTAIELRYCTLEIDSLGDYIIIDTSDVCRPSPFSSCTGGD